MKENCRSSLRKRIKSVNNCAVSYKLALTNFYARLKMKNKTWVLLASAAKKNF